MKYLYLIIILLAHTGCCWLTCHTCEPTIYYSPSGKPFPERWGKPPDIQTKDHRLLPYGYGYGSGTLNGWIMENTRKDLQRRFNNLPDNILLDMIVDPLSVW